MSLQIKQQRSVRLLRFPVRQYSRRRRLPSGSRWYFNAGAAYIYRIEANGSASYLNKVVAPDKAASDHFGYSVSQSGNILAVGAYLADPDGISEAGAAYIYRIEANGSASYLNKVVAPDKAASDYFGYSVSQSGNILAVGAYQADPDGISASGGRLYL